MFKCLVNVDENMQKELNNKSKSICLISLILGSIGLLAYIVISVFVELALLEYLLWIFAFLFVYGLIMLITINSTNKKSIERNIVDEITLYEDHLVEIVKQNGEVVATNKHYYKNFSKIKETKNYLFLYVNMLAAVPILKSSFSEEDFTKIKALINYCRQKNKKA